MRFQDARGQIDLLVANVTLRRRLHAEGPLPPLALLSSSEAGPLGLASRFQELLSAEFLHQALSQAGLKSNNSVYSPFERLRHDVPSICRRTIRLGAFCRVAEDSASRAAGRHFGRW